MEFCDMQCKYSDWPKDDALDGSGSCRTFQALYCKKRGQLVHKNLPCPDKVQEEAEEPTVSSGRPGSSRPDRVRLAKALSKG